MIIDQLPALTMAGDNDEIAIEVGQTTYKITKADFLKEFMPKAGGTFTGDVTFDEDVTVGGVLDSAQRRCYATLRSAGWYRVMIADYPSAETGYMRGKAAPLIRFGISRRGDAATSETHEILLMAGGWDVIKFADEKSVSGSLLIDKIRYCYNSSNSKAYVDIHYNSSGSNAVGVTLDVTAPTLAIFGQIKAASLEAVADAPSGETVLTTYELSADGIEKLSYTAWGKRWLFKRVGKIVFVESGEDGTTAEAGYQAVATLPARFAPEETKYQPIQNLHKNADYYGWAQIYATGVFRVYLSVAKSSTFNAAMSFCYLTK